MKRLTVMIKPTNNCNLRCEYCYHSEHQYTETKMDFKLFQKFIEKVIDVYDELHLIWHGGEPLIVGEPFYSEAIKIEKAYSDKILITNAIQTNGTLLTKSFVDLLANNDFQIGFSFDGEINEETRGSSEKTITGMQLYKNAGKRISAIMVLQKKNLADIKKTYDYFNSNEIDIKLNPLFRCKLVNNDSLLTAQEYASAIIDLFEYWVKDSSCNIRVDPIERYLSLHKRGARIDCSNSSCLTRFLSVDPLGNVYPCSRYSEKEYCLGNIDSFNTINDAYQSAGFEKILSGAIKRRKSCIESCSYFEFCQGGCNYDALIDGKLDANGFFSCTVFSIVYKYFSEYLTNIDNKNILNPRFIRIIETG